MSTTTTTTRRVGNGFGAYNTHRLTPREIREYRAKPGKFSMRFSELADELRTAGYRVHDAEVHRATQINYLDADEIRSIVDAFLADVKMITIAERFGVSVITVSNAVKNALILEKLERAQAVALLTGAPSAD